MPNHPDLDREALQHLATLARLHLTSERMPVLRARLQRLLEAFSALPAPTADLGSGPNVSGTHLAPSPATPSLATPSLATPSLGGPDMDRPGPGRNLILRTDEPTVPLPPAAVLANAPQQAAGAFLVPRVVDA